MAPRSPARLWAITRHYAEDVARTARLFLPETAERLRRACDDLLALLPTGPAPPALALDAMLGSVRQIEAEVEQSTALLPPDVGLLLAARTRLLRRRLAALDRSYGVGSDAPVR